MSGGEGTPRVKACGRSNRRPRISDPGGHWRGVAVNGREQGVDGAHEAGEADHLWAGGGEGL